MPIFMVTVPLAEDDTGGTLGALVTDAVSAAGALLEELEVAGGVAADVAGAREPGVGASAAAEITLQRQECQLKIHHHLQTDIVFIHGSGFVP